MKVFICEGRLFRIIDRAIIKSVDPTRQRVTVQSNVENIFGLHYEIGWVVLEEDPHCPDVGLTFSRRASIYNLFTFV